MQETTTLRVPTEHAQLSAARKLLSDAQLLTFFRAAAEDDDTPATRIIQTDLARGVDLDTFFDHFSQDHRLSNILWIDLKVKPLAARTFNIVFGFHGGEGAQWRVVYHPNGSLRRIVREVVWRP